MKDGDVMKMVKKNSVSILPNSKLEFKPMGYHLMLMQPMDKISENQSIEITQNGKLPLNFKIIFQTYR